MDWNAQNKCEGKIIDVSDMAYWSLNFISSGIAYMMKVNNMKCNLVTLKEHLEVINFQQILGVWEYNGSKYVRVY